MKRRIPSRDQSPCPASFSLSIPGRLAGAAMALTLVQGMGLMLNGSALASDMRANPKILTKPVVLDQNGRPLSLPTKQNADPVTLPAGVSPSFVAYHVTRPQDLPNGFPTVTTQPGRPGATTGPLYFNSQVKSQLAQDLSANSQVAVYNGKHTALLQPIPPIFGEKHTGKSAGNGKTLVWLANQAAASRAAAVPASNTTPVPTAVPAAQTLDPNQILTSITKSKLSKDIQHLLTINKGKLSNWNQQTLNAIKSDLRLSSPKNVAPHPAAAHKTISAAEELAPVGLGGTPQMAPVPEPGSLAIFGLAAAALAARGWRGHTRRQAKSR